jgi:hypothetical protein
MDNHSLFGRSRWLYPACGILLLSLAQVASTETLYRPGDSVEYKVRGSYPEKWAQGLVIREYPGGSQYLVREAPTRFFPDGPEMAYATSELRRPGSAPAPVVTPTATSRPVALENIAIHSGAGLLAQEELLALARRLMGDQPYADSFRREKVLEQIRDTIKARGTDFQYSAIGEFANRMYAQGTMSSHIGFAINSNYGPHPRLDDYFGTFHLRAASRGSKSAQSDGSRVIVITTDAQHESGALTINRDGTYLWAYLRGSAPETWKRGRWRAAAPEEMLPWEAGPAIWLLDAKQGSDYMVRMDRQPDWRGWIEVGAGKGRTPVEYGRRP